MLTTFLHEKYMSSAIKKYFEDHELPFSNPAETPMNVYQNPSMNTVYKLKFDKIFSDFSG